MLFFFVWKVFLFLLLGNLLRMFSTVVLLYDQGEGSRFKAFKQLDRQLLWHGSRTSNFAGILSTGLRIAPPEAPVTGYMFGKGEFFDVYVLT